MSLITTAVRHFVPVLARGRSADPRTDRLPYLMLASGLLALAVFHGLLLAFAWIALPAGLALAGAIAMLVWMRSMRHKALGKPHPGPAWFLAVMACLGLGLSAALSPLFGYKCAGMPALTALVWFGIVFAIWLYRDSN